MYLGMSQVFVRIKYKKETQLINIIAQNHSDVTKFMIDGFKSTKPGSNYNHTQGYV